MTWQKIVWLVFTLPAIISIFAMIFTWPPLDDQNNSLRRRRGAFILLSLEFIFLLIGAYVSAGFSVSLGWSWILIFILSIITIVAVIAFILAHPGRNQGANNGEKHLWNTDKGFGGNVFGDVATALFVLPGIGAYQLSGADQSWFWLGILGVYIGVLISVSQVQRSLLSLAHPGRVNSDAWDGVYSIVNMVISVLTLISLVSPVRTETTDSATSMVTISYPSHVRELYILIPVVIAAALLLALLISYWVVYVKDVQVNNANKHQARMVLAAVIINLILVAGAAIVTGVFRVVDATKATPQVLGGIAVGLWTLLEGVVLVRTFLEIGDSDINLAKLVRGVSIIAGNILLLIVLGLSWGKDLSSFEPIEWVLYGATLASQIIGTVTGISLGAYSHYVKYFAPAQPPPVPMQNLAQPVAQPVQVPQNAAPNNAVVQDLI